MESAEELITTKLNELQRQLAEKETKRKRAEAAAERRAEAAEKKREEEEAKEFAEYERIRREYEDAVSRGDTKEARRLERELGSVDIAPSYEATREAPRVSAAQARRDREIDELRIQVKLLEQIKEMLEQQHGETKAEFDAIEERDGRSSQQSFWLTVGSSTASLVAGWLLSLAGSPTAILHIFTH